MCGHVAAMCRFRDTDAFRGKVTVSQVEVQSPEFTDWHMEIEDLLAIVNHEVTSDCC
jgi:hypothetical protein